NARLQKECGDGQEGRFCVRWRQASGRANIPDRIAYCEKRDDGYGTNREVGEVRQPESWTTPSNWRSGAHEERRMEASKIRRRFFCEECADETRPGQRVSGHCSRWGGA
ncbi:hypothetical protein K438DRAFT_1872619, partial [Mycena galopus ATCC 62051]